MTKDLKIGVVSYGSRGAAIAKKFSENPYRPALYIASKQRNPLNISLAEKSGGEHAVLNLKDIDTLSGFFGQYKPDFIFVGPEDPIIAGLRDRIEDEYGIPVICPTQEYALKGSKVKQRKLLEEVAPEANPRFKVFSHEEYESGSPGKRRSDFLNWCDELSEEIVIKPDKPGHGKGVVVYGDHFDDMETAYRLFEENFEDGDVIVEKKLDGEESSHQVLCDGEHLIHLPETRDYKRRYDGDKGNQTGGMGTYKDAGYILPFMTQADYDREVEIIEKLFKYLKDENVTEAGLRGIPFYVGFMHTADGLKVLEINSRGGDPEFETLLPLLRNDFVDVSQSMIKGNLTGVYMDSKASVLIYGVPPNYADSSVPKSPDKKIDLRKAYEVEKNSRGNVYVIPGDIDLVDGTTLLRSSRAVAFVGIADSIESALWYALQGCNRVKGLDHRSDIASESNIAASKSHMKRLRARR
jgi:phosphoribosylamine--glycine ligase